MTSNLNEIVGEPNLSFQHTKRDGVLLHTQMKTAHSIPRLESSWVTTPCDCDSATKLVKLINLASKEELAFTIQHVLWLIEGNGTQYPSNYFISKDTIFQAITNRIGGSDGNTRGFNRVR